MAINVLNKRPIMNSSNVKISKKIIIIFSLLLLAIISLIAINIDNKVAPDENTTSSYNVSDIKQAIIKAMRSNNDNRDESYVQLSENISQYDKIWLKVPVTFIDEIPNSYDRQYIFIIKADKIPMTVVLYKPLGGFSNEDIPDEVPSELRDEVLGEIHG